MSMIGPFAQAEAQYRQSRLISSEIESYRRVRRARRAARRAAAERRRAPWRRLTRSNQVRPA